MGSDKVFGLDDLNDSHAIHASFTALRFQSHSLFRSDAPSNQGQVSEADLSTDPALHLRLHDAETSEPLPGQFHRPSTSFFAEITNTETTQRSAAATEHSEYEN